MNLKIIFLLGIFYLNIFAANIDELEANVSCVKISAGENIAEQLLSPPKSPTNAKQPHESFNKKLKKITEVTGLGIALATLEIGSQICEGLQKIGRTFSCTTQGEGRVDSFKKGIIQLAESPIKSFSMALEAKTVIDISEQEPVVNSDILNNHSPLNIGVPKKEDRIVIVGAGPAGIHMAYLLKEKGYKNVKILEKTDRIGGKSFTVMKQGFPQELGTCYTIAGKYGELRRVMKDSPSFEEVGIDSDARAFYSTPNSNSTLTIDEWFLSAIQSQFPYNYLPSSVAKGKLLIDLIKYRNLYNSIFGGYRPSVPLQPTQKNARKIDKTFKTFLEENNLGSLLPILSLSNTLQGYGYIDQVPAFYGLWWNSPALINGFIANGINNNKATSSLLKHGFQKVSEDLIAKSGLNVLTGYTIKSIKRKKAIKIKGCLKGQDYNLNADFIVLAANLKDSLGYLSDATAREKEIFGSLESTNIVTTLFSCAFQPGLRPIQDYTCNISSSSQGDMTCHRCNSRLLVNNEEPPREYRVVLQYCPKTLDPNDDYKKELLERLENNLITAGAKEISIEKDQQHMWAYFSRFNQEGINKGYPWEILKMQGTKNTWYAGASACFESLHDVYEYNRFLVSHLTA